MRSTFTGLEIAKRSLFAQQTAQQVTAHNIANANTVGYTRQSVNLIASRPIEAPGLQRSAIPGQLGLGVEFDAINRIRETFLDHQYYNENKALGDWSVRSDMLEKLEAIVNEPSDTGIRKVLDNFWNSWQDFSKEPENLTARASLKESALALTDAFNHMAKQMADLTADITDNINVRITEVNTKLNQIAVLNNEIYRIEGLGDNANDLRDQRDLLTDELSKIINITVNETTSGYHIRMGNIELVTGSTVSTVFDAQMMAGAMQSGDLDSGQIHGLFVSRDQYAADYTRQMDTMVKTLAEGTVKVTLPKGAVVPEGTTINGVTYSGSVANRTLAADTETVVSGINGMHELGYSFSDPPQTGIPFFTLKPGATEFTAANVTVNPVIVDNVSNIAASLRVYDDNGTERVVKGNNELALAIAGFRMERFNFDPAALGDTPLTTGTFDEFFRAFVGQLGVQAEEANRQRDNQTVLVNQVDARRQSVSGVSLDEEMAGMIKFQHAYNAAARVMTTFDEMLDKIINGMGIVGR